MTTKQIPCTNGYTLNADNYADAAKALYWYAANYHGGQDSKLYSILSTSIYRPGLMESGVEGDDEAEAWYADLESGLLDPETLADSIKLIADTI